MPEKSERALLADRLAALVCDNGLANPHGGDVTKGSRSYEITFSTPRYLDGSISVYGPAFIRISFQTGYRALPFRAAVVFRTEQKAMEFLVAAFRDFDFDRATALLSEAKVSRP